MKRNTLFLRLYLSFVLLLVTPILVLGLLFRSNLVRSYQQEVTDSGLSRVEFRRDVADDFLGDVRRTSLDLSFSPTLNRLNSVGDTISGADVEHVFAVRDVLNLLTGLQPAEGRIHSLYLYSERTGTVFTSESEIEAAETFRDLSWARSLEREMLLPFWIGPRVPIDADKQTIVRPPYLRGFDATPVVTLVAPLNSSATTLPGAIVANVTIDALLGVLAGEGVDSNREAFIHDASAGTTYGADGFYSNEAALERLHVSEITGLEQESGYVTGRGDRDQGIVFFAKSRVADWVYLDYNESSDFYSNVSAVTTLVVVVSVLLVFGGIGVAYPVSRWLYNPVGRLVEDIRERVGVDVLSDSRDMALLNQAFAGLRQQESALLGATERSRRKLREHLLMQLLQGADNGDDLDAAGLSFPYTHFLCAVAAIDDLARFEQTYSREQRHYLKELILKIANEVIGTSFAWSALQYDNDKLVFVFNVAGDEWISSAESIADRLREIQAQAFNALRIEITWSLGSALSGREGIERSFLEAIEGLKYRLIAGYRSIIRRWIQLQVTPRFEDPSIELTRVFNYLKLGSEDKIEGALDAYFNAIGTDSGGYYGAIQSVNMLLADTIEYLMGEHVDPAEIFGDGVHPYEQLSSFETIEAMRAWFATVFRSIIAHQDASPLAGSKYLVRLVDYIDQHYTEDLSADEIAGSIGVSYSYMRRLFSEHLRVSFHDYLNRKRIDRAKELLNSTDWTLRAIATAVGYNNDQSFARFFKKYEGITPGEYRRIS